MKDFFCFSVCRGFNFNWVLRHCNWVNTQILCLSGALHYGLTLVTVAQTVISPFLKFSYDYGNRLLKLY